MGEKIKSLEKMKAKECKKSNSLQLSLEELTEEAKGLRLKVKLNQDKFLQDFQESKKYMDALEGSYLEGFTDLYEQCVVHFGEEAMKWALDNTIDHTTLRVVEGASLGETLLEGLGSIDPQLIGQGMVESLPVGQGTIQTDHETRGLTDKEVGGADALADSYLEFPPEMGGALDGEKNGVPDTLADS